MPTSPAQGAAKLLVANGVILVSGFLISIILARGLGPSEFGVYGVVISVVVWLERLLNGGVPKATMTLWARHEHDRDSVEQSARALMFLWSLPLFAFLWMIAPNLAEFFQIRDGAAAFRIVALNIPAMSLFFAYQGILNARYLFYAESTMLILQSLAKLGGILILLTIGLSVTGALVVHVLATAIAIFYMALNFWPGRRLPSKEMMLDMARIAWPMGGYHVALAMLATLSLWQLKASLGEDGESVGFYAASLNLTRVLLVVPASISTTLYAALSWAIAAERADRARESVQQSSRFALITLTPACILLVLHAEEVMRLLYGPNYAAGGAILALLCVAFTLFTFLDIYFHALMAHGRYSIGSVVLLCLIPALAIMNFILIPLWSGVGAAAASLAALGAGAIIASTLAYRQFGALVRPTTLLRVVIAAFAVLMLDQILVLAGALFVIEMALYFVAYLLTLVVTGELSRDDLKHFGMWKPNTM